MARGFAAGAALLAALSLLGGCSVFQGAAVPCPAVGALDGADRLTRFGDGGKRGPADMEFRAHIANLAAECRFESGAKTGSIDLDIGFRAQRAPAGSAAAHAFGYFVAVVDPEGGVAAREAFSVRVPFEGSETEAAMAEALVLDIPVKENAPLSAYRIYVGMQLTREQFERNPGGGG